MLASDKQTDLTARLLTQEFLLQYPQKSARHLENMSSVEAAALLQEQPVYVVRGCGVFYLRELLMRFLSIMAMKVPQSY